MSISEPAVPDPAEELAQNGARRETFLTRLAVRAAPFALLLAWSAPAQDFSNIRIDTGGRGLRVSPKGPAWSPMGFLIFSDIPTTSCSSSSRASRPVRFPGEIERRERERFDAQGRLYTCETHSRRVTRTDKKGNVEVLAERWQGKRLNAPNDIVVRKDGHVYFTDPAFGNQQDARELDFYGVYHISRKGELEVIAKPKGRPNGVALSPNGRVALCEQLGRAQRPGYDLDHNGAASNERVLVSGIEGVPNGMRVDEKGNLYLAANKIEVYTADGKSLGAIETAEAPSNCAFGDADFEGLYITARTSVYHVRLNVKGSVKY